MFKPGAPGRPKGARNKLDAFAYGCALAHAQHKMGDPAPPEYAHTSLWAALEVTLADDPEAYLARVISMLPKQLSIESSLGSYDDDEIDRLLAELKERVLEQRAPPSPLLLESKVINGHDQG